MPDKIKVIKYIEHSCIHRQDEGAFSIFRKHVEQSIRGIVKKKVERTEYELNN